MICQALSRNTGGKIILTDIILIGFPLSWNKQSNFLYSSIHSPRLLHISLFSSLLLPQTMQVNLSTKDNTVWSPQFYKGWQATVQWSKAKHSFIRHFCSCKQSQDNSARYKHSNHSSATWAWPAALCETFAAVRIWLIQPKLPTALASPASLSAPSIQRVSQQHTEQILQSSHMVTYNPVQGKWAPHNHYLPLPSFQK